jgi:hypothetical protein
MTSSINPANINGSYPVAGVDNDSQGFRDNFTNTKNNLTITKAEIEDLQSKAVLLSPLTGGATSNLNVFSSNVTMSKAKTHNFTQSLGVISGTAGSITVDYTSGDLQTLSTTANITVVFDNWPTSGSYATTRLLVDVASVSHWLILPAEVTIGIANVPGFTTAVTAIKPTTIGKHLLEFGTFNGGTSIMVATIIKP